MDKLKNIFSEKNLPVHLFFLLAFFLLTLFYYSETSFDTGDGIRHYLISRYSWVHKYLFLDSWGKPFFTLISSPFSQFGIYGTIFFNVLCGLISAYLGYKIAKKINLNYPFLIFAFLLFSTIYFPVMNSGLTEPFFGLILIASIYFIFNEKYLKGAILISFLPFVRSEGFLVIPLFFIYLVIIKQYKSSLFTAFGILFYTIVGGIYYRDLLWIIHLNPYDGSGKEFYGSGDLFHFVNMYDEIWGLVLFILFIAGLLVWIPKLFSKNKLQDHSQKNKTWIKEVLLIYGPFLVYFIAHSIMWWKGAANSLGLIRVVAGVMPCSALICLRGFNLLMIPAIKKNKLVEFYAIVITLFFVVKAPFELYYFPFVNNMEQQTIEDAGKWFKKSKYKNQKIFYLYPSLITIIEKDPFDTLQVNELWSLYPNIKKYGIKSIPDSSVVFWDAHFGPNESNIPLDTIKNDPNFELIKSFEPPVPIEVLGNNNFAVHLFLKLPKPIQWNITNKHFCDFEKNKTASDEVFSEATDFAFSGLRVGVLNTMREYSYTFEDTIVNISDLATEIEFNGMIYSKNDTSKNFSVVCAISDSTGKALFWEGRKNEKSFNLNEWTPIKETFKFDKKAFKSSDIIKVFIWNNNKESFYIDDLSLYFRGRY